MIRRASSYDTLGICRSSKVGIESGVSSDASSVAARSTSSTVVGSASNVGAFWARWRRSNQEQLNISYAKRGKTYLAHLKKGEISTLPSLDCLCLLLLVPVDQLGPCLHRWPSLHDIVVHFWNKPNSDISASMSQRGRSAHFDSNHPFSISIIFSASSETSAHRPTPTHELLTKHVIRPSDLC
jgi:beta-mannanase